MATLEQAQQDLLAFGSDDSLLKSLLNIGDQLEKSKGKAAPMDADESEESDESDDDADDLDGADDGDDESDGDEDGDDEAMEDDSEESDESDDEPPPPTTKGKGKAFGKSQGTAGDQLIKSLVQDETGTLNSYGEMIEATDVLLHLTDTLAKSFDGQEAAIGAVEIKSDRQLEMLEMLAKSQAILTKAIQNIAVVLGGAPLAKSQQTQAVHTPFPGVVKPSTRTNQVNTDAPLTKSRATNGILNAHAAGRISDDQRRSALTRVDSLGAEESLKLLPADVAEAIRTGEI